MIPARDRQLQLNIYSTRADMEANTNATIITTGINSGTARFEHIFFSSLPGWGEANASMFTCDIDTETDLTGKYMRVYVNAYATEEATARTAYGLVWARIDSCKYDRYKTTRTLIAYDRLYELRSVDISAWWNNYVAGLTAASVTADSVLQAMCTEYGVTKASTLPAFTIYTAPLKARKLGACSFTQMLGYLGECCRCYFSYQWYGLRHVAMNTISAAEALGNIDDLIDASTTEIEDTVLEPYQQLTIYEGNNIVYSNGSGKALAVTDNPLLVGRTTAQLSSIGLVLYTAARAINGIKAATIDLVYAQAEQAWTRATTSDPFIVTTTDGTETRRHLVSGILLSGSGLIDETLQCTGEMAAGASYGAAQNALLGELSNLGTELTFKVNANAVIEAVNLEAQGGVQINAEALNINGVQSTGGKLKVGVNGDVEVDGKITSSNGEIGGWTIGNGMISKTVTVEGYEYRVILYAPASPTTGITAIGLQKRAVGAATWSQVSRFTYGGTLESTDAKFNGRLVINPDLGALRPGEHVFEIHDNDNNMHMMIDPAYILFTEGASLAADTSLHIGATEVNQYVGDSAASYPKTEAQYIREMYAYAQSQHEYFREIYQASASSETVYEQHRTPRKLELTAGIDKSILTASSLEIAGHSIHRGDAVTYEIDYDGVLNDYLTEGRYFAISNISNISDCPTSTPFVLEVFRPRYFGSDSPTFVYQRLTDSTAAVYVRAYRVSTTTWTDWKRIAQTDDRATTTTFTPTGVTSATAQGGCYYSILNGQVHLHIAVSGLTANTNANIYTLPAAARPSASMVTGVGFGSALADNITSRVVVTTAGVITLRSTSTTARIDISYFT